MRAPYHIVAQRAGGARYIWEARLPNMEAARASAWRCLRLQADVAEARIVSHPNTWEETIRRGQAAAEDR